MIACDDGNDTEFSCDSCDTTTQFCNETTKTCDPKSSFSCDSCDAATQICNEAEKKCDPKPEFSCDSCDSSYQTCNEAEKKCDLMAGKCLTAAECSGATPDCDTTTHICFGATIYPIRKKTVALDSTVTVTGTATGVYKDGNDVKGIYIQESGVDYRGIYVYLDEPGSSAVKIGDVVTVTGTYVEWYELSEIKIATASAIKINGNTPITTFSEITPATFASGALEPYESMLVSIKGNFTVGGRDSNGNIEVTNSDGSLVKVHPTLFTFTLNAGDKLTEIRGVVGYNYEQFKIFPRTQADLVDNSVLCSTITCGTGEICNITDNVASCICDETDGYFGTTGSCTNPCTKSSCSETFKTVCTATSATEFTCSCDSGYMLEGDNCVEITCFDVRAVAGNITSGNKQTYDPGHGIRIFQGLKPDVVMVQEFNYGSNSDSDIRSFVDKAFGSEFYYARGRNSGSIPNGVISRWPILDSGYWIGFSPSTRDLDWAIIDLPGTRHLFVISVHLHTGGDKMADAIIVANKINEIKSDTTHPYCKNNGCYFMVGGDMNGSSPVSNNGFNKYGDFNVSKPHPVGPCHKGEKGCENEDSDGYGSTDGTNASRKSQYDFVVPGIDLKPYQKPVVISNPEYTNKELIYNNGLVFDSRGYTQTDLSVYFSPVQVNDSDASNMQHMAIVKDFYVCK